MTREAITDGYETCPVTSMPAAEVEGAALDQVHRLLAAPELVARTWATVKRESEDEITEREVMALLSDFAGSGASCSRRSSRGSSSFSSSGSTYWTTRLRSESERGAGEPALSQPAYNAPKPAAAVAKWGRCHAFGSYGDARADGRLQARRLQSDEVEAPRAGARASSEGSPSCGRIASTV